MQSAGLALPADCAQEGKPFLTQATHNEQTKQPTTTTKQNKQKNSPARRPPEFAT